MIPPILMDAIIFASLLSILSTGLTFTYMTTKVPNFAHGDFAGLSTYISLMVVGILGFNPYVGLIPGFLIGGVIAITLYVLILRPLLDKGASHVILMIATIAFDMVLISVINILADYLSNAYKVVTKMFILRSYDLQVFGQPGVFYASLLLVFFMVLTLYIFLNKTRFGIAMRAAIENPSLAEVLGINVNFTYAVSWFISGGLAGVAGILLPLWLMSNPDIGMRLIVSVFAASIVGGLTNIYGAFIGGFLIGLAEVLGTNYLSLTVGSWIIPYRPVIPLAIMALTLLFAPKGLTGISWKRVLKRGD